MGRTQETLPTFKHKVMRVIKGIILSKTEPPSTDVLWMRPVEGGIALYLFDGLWKILRLMNDHGTMTTDDDTPIDIHEGQLEPDTVGTEQIISNSVIMDDLNDSVKDKIQKTYHQNAEALHMDYDIAEEDNDNETTD